MRKIALFTRDERFVAKALLPPFKPMPEVVVWGERFFVRSDDDDSHYYEAFTFVIPVPSEVQT